MTSAMLRQTRWTILLSLNAAAILVAGDFNRERDFWRGVRFYGGRGKVGRS